MSWLLQQRPSVPGRAKGPAGLDLVFQLLMDIAWGCDLPTLRYLVYALRGYNSSSSEHWAGLRGELVPVHGGTDGEHPCHGLLQRLLQPAPQAPALAQAEVSALSVRAHWERNAGALLAHAASSRVADWQAKVEWLEALGCPRTAQATELAAVRKDALARLTWLRQRGYPIGEGAVQQAAKRGFLDAVRYALSEGAQPGEAAATFAASEGHLEVLRLILDATGGAFADEALWAAARHGRMAVVVWLVESPALALNLGYRTASMAASSGSVELLTWLLGRGCAFDFECFYCAASSGCAPMLELLLGRGCVMPTHGDLLTHSARVGDLATVRCLRRLGCPWGQSSFLLERCVSMGVCLPMLRCLLELGCPVNWGVAISAARRSSKEVRQWLLETAREQRWQRLKAFLAYEPDIFIIAAWSVVALAALTGAWMSMHNTS